MTAKLVFLIFVQMFKAGLSILFLSILFSAKAQDAQVDESSKFGIGFSRFGFAFHYETPLASNSKKIRGLHLNTEIGNIMNPNEIAIINPNVSGQRGVYKYQKINYAWSIKPLIGKTFLFGNIDPSGVIPSIKVSAGPAIAYQWPVYINYLSIDTSNQNAVINEVKYNPEVHSQQLIAEKASFTNDITKGNMRLGLSARIGFDFYVSNNLGGYRAIGIGAKMEYYPEKALSIYYDDNLNRVVYSSFCINFAIGN